MDVVGTFHFAVFIGIAVGFGNAQIFEATPSNFTPNFTPELHLNCHIKSLLHTVDQVFVLQVDREENGNLVPLATVTPAGVTINSVHLSGRVNATGDVRKTGQIGPHLNVTISQPTEHESGHYVCVASITDKTSTLIKLTFDANVTDMAITSDQIGLLVQKLTNKVNQAEATNSNLLNEIGQLQQRQIELTANISSTTSENAALRAEMTSLEQRLQDVERAVTMETNNNNGTDAALVTLVEELTIKVNNLSNSINNISRYTNNGVNNGGIVSNANSCSCYNALSNVSLELKALHTNQLIISQRLEDAKANYTHLTSEMIVDEANINSAIGRIGVLENMVTGQYQEIATLQNSAGMAKQQIFAANDAFYAQSGSITGELGDISFAVVAIDTDQFFTVKTGEFRAKHAGYYMVTVTLSIKMDHAGSLEAAIKVNNNLAGFVSTSAHGLLNSGSTTVIVHLNPNDPVKVTISKLVAPPVVLNPSGCSLVVVYLG